MKRKQFYIAAMALGSALFVSACGGAATNATSSAASESLQGGDSGDALNTNATKITGNDSGVTIDGDGATYADGVVTITAAGTYQISGTLQETQILIQAGEKDEVCLILNGATITNSTTAPISCESAGNFTIELADGTENTVSDLREASEEVQEVQEAQSEAKQNPGQPGQPGPQGENAPDSRDHRNRRETAPGQPSGQLGQNSQGQLPEGQQGGSDVAPDASSGATEQNKGNDDSENSQANAGKDNSETTSGGGAESKSESESESKSKSGADSSPNADSDSEETEVADAAIYSKADLILEGDGSLVINGGYEYGIHGKDSVTINSGTYTIDASKHGISGKDAVEIAAGTFTITAGEDGVHSKGNVTIFGGNLDLSVGDDGMHADAALVVKDGSVNVTKANEGLEGQSVDIDGGSITIQCDDDGLNAASESEDSGEPGGSFAVDEDAYINITGGTIRITAQGDGIDSNGDVTISGGVTIVDGPASGGNNVIDFNGSASVDGGTVLATGMQGMFQSFDENSEQPVIIEYFDSSQSGGTSVSIKDSDGNKIFTLDDLSQDFNVIQFSSDELESGKTYTITVGDNSENVTISSEINSIGTASSKNSGGNMRGGMRMQTG